RMCTGVLPFQGDDALAILSALARDQPATPRQFNPEVPAALSDLILKLLAKKPEERYASATAVAEELAALGSAARNRKRPALFPWLAAGMAAALLAGTLIYVQTNKGKLILEVHEPDVKVTVDGEVIKIKSPRDEITVSAGGHKLKVTKEGFTSYNDEFEIR